MIKANLLLKLKACLLFILVALMLPLNSQLYAECELSNLIVDPGNCNGDGYYELYIDFDYVDVELVGFDIYGVDESFFGFYSYSDLPLTIPNYALGDGNTHYIKVAENDNPDCFTELEFTSPVCSIPSCEISNVYAEAHPCDEDGNFLLDFEFDYANTSGSFIVAGNGNNYGTFNYGETFYTIGPLAGDGVTTWEFIITDSEIDGCLGFAFIEPIECSPLPCSINSLVADAGACNEDGSFDLTINFNYANTPSGGFDIYNGADYITSVTDDPPFTISSFAQGDGNNVNLIVTANDMPSCAAEIELETEDCTPGECTITNVIAEAHPCDGDGNFLVDIAFDSENTSGSFSILGNGNNYGGSFAYGEPFYTIGPIGGDGVTTLEFVVTDFEIEDCSAFTTIEPIDCTPALECEIWDIVAESYCAAGQLLIDFQFNYSGFTNDFIDVYIDGVIYGYFEVGAPFYTIELPADYQGGLIQLGIGENDNADCFNSILVELPPCEGTECAIDGLWVEQLVCDGEVFSVELGFDYFNVGTEGFTVQGNGTNYGNFNYEDLPITLGPLAGDCETVWEFGVIDLSVDNCNMWTGIDPVCCEEPVACEIWDVVAEPYCDGNELLLDFEFNYSAFTNDFIDVYVDGVIYTTFEVGATYYSIVLPSEYEGGVIQLGIGENDNPDCFNSIVVELPVCEEPEDCQIVDIWVEPSACDGSMFYVDLSFEVLNLPADTEGFGVQGNGTYYGNFNYADLPITLGPLIGDGETNWEFMVFDMSDPGCMDIAVIEPVVCEEPADCEINDLWAEASNCDGGVFIVQLGFEYANVGNEGFTIQGNGINYGNFNYEDLPITLGPFEGDCETVWEFGIIDLSVDNCSTWTGIDPICCEEPIECEIWDLFGEPFCDGEEVFMEVGFLYTGFTNPYADIFINGEPITSVAVGSGSYTIEVPAWAEGVVTLSVSENDNPTCSTNIEIELPNCEPTCELDISLVEFGDCEFGQVYIDLIFDYEGPLNMLFLYMDGDFLGTYASDLDYITVGPIEGNGQEIAFTLSNMAVDCTSEILITTPLCEQPTVCEIGDITYEYTCNEDGTLSLWFDFDSANLDSDGFIITGMGYSEYYEYANLPIQIDGLAGDEENYVFLISDFVNSDCTADIIFEAPICESPLCEIGEIVYEIECNDDLSINLWIDFEYADNASNVFIVEGGEGLFETYLYIDLPVLIEGVQGNGSSYEFIVYDMDLSDCTNTFSFESPICEPPVCEMGEINYEYECNADLTFNLLINFEYDNNPSEVFLIEGPDGLLGEYFYADLPLVLEGFEGNGDTYDFLIYDAIANDCTSNFSFETPVCEPPFCEIGDIVYEYACNLDLTFDLWINFAYEDNESAVFLIDGPNGLIGEYLYTNLPIVLENFEATGEMYEFEIYDGANLDCANTFSFESPSCEGISCEIGEINYGYECNEDGTFNLTINFEYSNNESTVFLVEGPVGGLGEYLYTNLPLVLEDLEGNGEVYEFEIYDGANSDCANTFSFESPTCEEPVVCAIGEINYGYECNEDGTFNLTINFEYSNNESAVFLVDGPNGLIGEFLYVDLPLVLEGFEGNGEVFDFEIYDGANLDCANTFSFESPTCEEPVVCAIGEINYGYECNEDGTFNLTINFDSSNTSDSFIVEGSGFIEDYAYANLPIVIEGLAGNGENYEFIVYDVGSNNCSSDFSFAAPICEGPAPECEIIGLLAEASECDGGVFYVQLNFEYANVGDEGFTVQGNGTNYGNFNYEDLPITLGPFEGDCETVWEFGIIDLSVDNCSTWTGIDPICCEEPFECVINEVNAELIECGEEEIYIELNFNYAGNGNDGFSVIVNGENQGGFPYEDLPLTLELADAGNFEIEIYDNQIEDCQAVYTIEDWTCGADVWPGDINYDGVASNFDLLFLGIAFGSTGDTRPNADLNWEAQWCLDWTDDFSTADNYKHADTDGDGEITDMDTLAIYQNYGQIHGKTEGEASEDEAPLFVDLPEDAVEEGSLVEAPVVFGSNEYPGVDVYGVAFTIEYDAAIVEPGSVKVNFDNCWLGEEDEDMLSLIHNPKEAEIYVALARKNQINMSGFGQIGELSFILIENVEGKTEGLIYEYQVTIKDVLIISYDETELAYSLPEEYGEILTSNELFNQSNLDIYPNPSKDNINIKGLNDNEQSLIKLYNVNGQLVKQVSTFGQSTQLDVSDLSQGIYCIEIISDERRLVQKVEVIK